MPGLSWFQELNLRIYVHDENGAPGVWFFSLDCKQWLAVKIARKFFNLPYEHARMSAQRENGIITYRSARRADDIAQDFVYPAAAGETKTAQAGSLEFFCWSAICYSAWTKAGIFMRAKCITSLTNTGKSRCRHTRRGFSPCTISRNQPAHLFPASSANPCKSTSIPYGN